MVYDFNQIEKKWQKYWLDNKTFSARIDTTKPKYYVLDMFPYPSGAGLHVGHVENYTISDIMARYKRMQGFNVLHPMGWDAFGLPTERYAERTKQHPKDVVQQNITTFKGQLQKVGFSYDWDREINTTDPDYYKWTQWIFSILYKKGLAYEQEAMVNWCPKMGTVLANEEVKDGKYVETGDEVIKKPLKQWMLNIKAYAEKLLQGLDKLDWPESIKTMQREWIGKSEGADVIFKVDGKEAEFTVYTTRVDTLFGATFCALAPEHALIKEIVSSEQKEVVQDYIALAQQKSSQDRMADEKEKTGVFTGAYAINPVNQKRIPIYVADYVLGDYGYGAVMAVAAHDERDYAFAKKYNLPLIQVLEGDISENAFTGDAPHINSDFLNGLMISEAKDKLIQWLEENHCGKRTVNYRLHDWLFSRQRYWGEPFPILHLEDGSIKCLNVEDLPVLLPPTAEFRPTEDGESPLGRMEEWVNVIDEDTGKKAKREINTMPQWAGSSWYFLRFCDAQNLKEAWSKEAESYWMPVDFYVGGVEHAVLHLLYARFWQKVLFDAGLVSTDEPFKRLINQGMILAFSYKDLAGKYYYPHEVERRGNNIFVKGTDVPVVSQVEKMSKSKNNVVNPDDIVEKFGADSMRLYEMFMGPIEAEKPWTDEGINGVYRFLKKVWGLFEIQDKISDTNCDPKLTQLLHKTIKGVTDDMERLAYNTAISKMMEFINAVYRSDCSLKKEDMEKFILLLAPQAPHIAEEMWEMLGHDTSLAYEKWPSYDESLLQEDTQNIVIQVLGKKRDVICVPKDISKEVLIEEAKKSEKVKSFLQDKKIIKEIYVPNKLVNFVVQEG